MVSIVSSAEQSQIIYPVDDVDGPAPTRPTNEEFKVALSIVDSLADGGSDLPAPKATDSLTQKNTLELVTTDSQTAIEDVMKLVYEWANKTRQVERAVRQSELKAQVDVELASAQKLRDAAEANFRAAVVEGVMGIAAGMVSIGCNVKAFKVSANGLKSENKATELRTKATNPDNKNAAEDTKLAIQHEQRSKSAQSASMAWNGIGMGASQAISSTGSIGGAAFKREADLNSADAKQLDALATAHQAATEQASDRVREMQDLMQDILQKMAAIMQIQHDTMGKIVG